MTTHQFIQKVDGGIVRPSVWNLGELAYDIIDSDIMGRTIKVVLDFLLRCAHRKLNRGLIYRAKNLCRQVCVVLGHFAYIDQLCKLIKRLHVSGKECLVTFYLLGWPRFSN